MNICVISDTHLQNDFSLIPPQAIKIIKKSELVVHCGDIVSNNAYEYFKSLNKYFVAVQGNWDYDLPFLEVKDMLEIEGFKVGITHGHLRVKPTLTTEINVLSMFAGNLPDIIFFGHTHQIKDKFFGKVRLINPGSLIEGKKSLMQVNIVKNKVEVSVKYF